MQQGIGKIIIIVIIVVVLAVGAGIGYWIGQGTKPSAEGRPLATQGGNQDSKSEAPFVGDDFTILPPAGWAQAHLPSTLVSFHNLKEVQPKGSEAEKINFKSYMAVSSYSRNGKTLDEIADLVKRQVAGVAPTISFAPITDGTINGQPAKFIEANVSMQGVDFKVMLAVAMKGDKYFTISSNTTVEKWPEYRDIFYNVLNSFKFKYQ